MMRRVLAAHLRFADLLVRLVQLHVLWMGWSLRGGLVLGVFPATAALAAVARRDAMASGLADERAGWRPLRAEFRSAWRREFGHANRLGWPLAGLGAFLVIDERLVRVVEPNAALTFAAGVLWILVALLVAIAVTCWPLAAHFDESPLAVAARAARLLIGRPLAALAHLGTFAGVLALYYLIPGLAPVFGLAAPIWLATAALWSTGVMPQPAASRA